MTYRSSKSDHVCAHEPKNKVKKGIPKKPQHVFFHVFAQTTHVVAAPHGFACVVIPATRLYILSFTEIRSGVSEPRGVKIWPFPLLWLVAFTTACTTVQAVIQVTQNKQNQLNILVRSPPTTSGLQTKWDDSGRKERGDINDLLSITNRHQTDRHLK